jgi:hypothetical protein
MNGRAIDRSSKGHAKFVYTTQKFEDGWSSLEEFIEI